MRNNGRGFGFAGVALVVMLLGITERAGAEFAVTASIDFSVTGKPINSLIFGTNLQWVDRGDEILLPEGTFNPAILSRLRAMAPTVLRYPGGTQSDTYAWHSGIGPPSQRGTSVHAFLNHPQEMLFGTDEFLQLCSELRAEPLITLNLASDRPSSAAEWVAYTNKRPGNAEHASLPKVRFWEIGNEPYLKPDGPPRLALDPEEYIKRASDTITAIKAVDPGISVGIPLRSDVIGGKPATPYPGFNEKVLSAFKDLPVDFVAVHDAYAPAIFTGTSADNHDLFAALMAAPLQVAEDLEATRMAMRRHLGRTVPLAITEYNALFTIGGGIDSYVASLGSAIYIAEILRLFASADDVMLANYWSAAGNWHFGAVTQSGKPRPSFFVLEAFRHLAPGTLLPVSISAALMATPTQGYIMAREDVPMVDAIATRNAQQAIAFFINKNADEAGELTLNLISPIAASNVTAFELTGTSVFATSITGDTWQKVDRITVEDGRLRTQLKAFSIMMLKFQLV